MATCRLHGQVPFDAGENTKTTWCEQGMGSAVPCRQLHSGPNDLGYLLNDATQVTYMPCVTSHLAAARL